MTDPFQKMDDVSQQARELAAKIAPLLKELRGELRGKHMNQKASYILLLAAAGFLTEEVVDRRISAPLISEVADAVAQDLIPGQHF